MPAGSILRVAVGPRFAAPLLDYLGPESGPVPPAGVRVSVPLGAGRRTGIVLGRLAKSDMPSDRLRRVLAVLDADPLWDPVTHELLLWAADYYCHLLGQVLAYAIPQQLRRGGSLPEAPRRWRAAVEEVGAALATLKRAPKQQELLKQLLAAGDEGLVEAAFASSSHGWRKILAALREKGLAETFEPPAPEPSEALREEPLSLSAEQAVAVEAMRKSRGFACHLLDGVTASGKTEVYLHLVEEVLASGKQCLLLAPEIGLTPQLAGRLTARFSAPSAVLHSGLNESERLRAWADARSGRARLVVGTRSAVFTPCSELGLIVVDEEHDPSYKQQDGFRYQARDLAVMRASKEGIPVVLGSATPSLESLLNVQKGRYLRHRLAKKVTGARPPLARLVDLNRHPPENGLSKPLIRAMSEQLDSGAQVLLYLNRRGFAPVLMCPDCRKAQECGHCDARMVFYRKRDWLLCHHCGAGRRPPLRCEECGSGLNAIGRGTERLEEELAVRFPGVPLARMDRDNVRGRRRLEDILGGIRERHYRILLGTQMLTKGHDFPSLGLVGVIDADQGLFAQEFRGPERDGADAGAGSGSGRSAREAGAAGAADPLAGPPAAASAIEGGIRGVCRHRPWKYAGQAAGHRSHTWRCCAPNAPQAPSVSEFLDRAKACVPEPGKSGSAVQVLGPAPALMERRRDRSHAHLLTRSASRARLQEFLSRWIPEVRDLPRSRRVSWSVDVDPTEIG